MKGKLLENNLVILENGLPIQLGPCAHSFHFRATAISR